MNLLLGIRRFTGLLLCLALMIVPAASFARNCSPNAEPCIECEELASMDFGPLTSILSAEVVPATETLPQHCLVTGNILPEIGFAVQLPTDWNRRFYMAGGGGYAGDISWDGMNAGLGMGYATASTDTGHKASEEPLGIFAYDLNTYGQQKEIDYAFRAVHETALVAKKLISAYYCKALRYSYWVGCSTGGRQGLMEAQLYPSDFDGILAGAPVLDFSGTQMWGVWNAKALWGIAQIRISQLDTLADAVYNKCDGIDGLVDGLIDDPRECDFDPAVDLPRCTGDPFDHEDCFTDEQVVVLNKIYDGVRNSSGELLFPGQTPGAEAFAPNPFLPPGVLASGWQLWILNELPDGTPIPSLQLLFGETFMQYMAFIPDVGPTYNWMDFDFDVDPQNIIYSSILDAVNPDLSAFKCLGGKMIQYHGWADTALTPLMSTRYYEQVLDFMGELSAKSFYKLYMVPGMFHCGGGVGCDYVDWFTPLVNWVEKGKAPRALIGAHIEGEDVIRTRPLCPYPKVAKYKGRGSIDDADNFVCVDPDWPRFPRWKHGK